MSAVATKPRSWWRPRANGASCANARRDAGRPRASNLHWMPQHGRQSESSRPMRFGDAARACLRRARGRVARRTQAAGVSNALASAWVAASDVAHSGIALARTPEGVVRGSAMPFDAAQAYGRRARLGRQDKGARCAPWSGCGCSKGSTHNPRCVGSPRTAQNWRTF